MGDKAVDLKEDTCLDFEAYFGESSSWFSCMLGVLVWELDSNLIASAFPIQSKEGDRGDRTSGYGPMVPWLMIGMCSKKLCSRGFEKSYIDQDYYFSLGLNDS